MKQEVKLRGRRPSLAATQSYSSAPQNQIPAGTKIEPPSPPYREGGGGSLLPDSGAKSKVDQVLESLSKVERAELLDRLALDRVAPRNQHRDLDMWATAVYEAFVELVGAAMASGIGPAVVKKLLAAPTCWQPVEDFVAASRLADLPVAGRQSAYRTLAALLVRHARSVARHTGIPMSFKLVANNCGQIAGIFDDAFPGYAAAGMARIVVSRNMAELRVA